MPSREPELYKDKIEVSLDGRQIFYLFFGGAVIVGLVFVLGVMVGRRVEARGHLDRAEIRAARDPLAALDRLEGSDNLSFHGAITGSEAPTDVEKAIASASPPANGDGKPVKPEAKPEAKSEAKTDAKPEGKTDARTDGKSSVKTDGRTDGKPSAKTGSEARGKFTLQLSSFQDKNEAQAYLDSMKSAGYQAYVSEGAVDGKQYFRVRLGSYRTMDAANSAKQEIEKAMKKSAVVMKL